MGRIKYKFLPMVSAKFMLTEEGESRAGPDDLGQVCMAFTGGIASFDFILQGFRETEFLDGAEEAAIAQHTLIADHLQEFFDELIEQGLLQVVN